MINLVSISQALIVAEHLSFSRAARVLGVRQSAVSRRVQALEDELGVSLFERDVTGVRLTEAGRRFFDRSRSALAEIDHAVKGAASAGCGAEGVLRIGILSSLSQGLIRDLLGAFRRTHPAITIDVVDGSQSEHLTRISERLLDVALVIGEPSASHCDTLILWESGVFAALPEGHRLADTVALGWAALKNEQFIVTRHAPGPQIHDHIVRRLGDLGHVPAVERYGVGRETLMHMVALGFGISVIGEAGTATRYPEVVFRPLAPAEEDRVSYSAFWLPGNDNPALRRFVSLARSMSSSRPALQAPA